MDIVSDQDPRLLAWAAERLKVPPWDPQHVRWLSGWSETAPVFVVVYSRFSPRNCELTIATDGTKRWASRQSLRAIFHIPFTQWALRRVTFVVRADNPVSIAMCERLGAVREGTVRQAFADDVDGVLLGMLKGECRWIA